MDAYPDHLEAWHFFIAQSVIKGSKSSGLLEQSKLQIERLRSPVINEPPLNNGRAVSAGSSALLSEVS